MPSTHFQELPLSPETLQILAKLELTTPTPIQAQAIAPAREGRDVLGLAQTGSGKTLAFALPILEQLRESGKRALVIVPTRELALQVETTFKKLGIRTTCIIGGAPMNKQIFALKRQPEVVIGTPGRLQDHANQHTIRLREFDIVVLDEADRMFDMGFAPAIKRLLEATRPNRQTLMFSATMPPEIADLAAHHQVDPVRIEIERPGTAAETIDQELIVVDHAARQDLLAELLYETKGPVLVFVRTRHGARKLAKHVNGLGIAAVELHADRTLAQRRQAMDAFRSHEVRILVATDIAARGIDVKEIELVVNFDLPEQPEDYVHRIGRTGRAGAIGKSITFATPQQSKEVSTLERLLGQEIPRSPRSTAELPKFHRPPQRPRTGEVRAHAARPEVRRPDRNRPDRERPDHGRAGADRPYRRDEDRSGTQPRFEDRGNRFEAREQSQPRESQDRGRYQDRRPQFDRRSADSAPANRFHDDRPGNDRARDARPPKHVRPSEADVRYERPRHEPKEERYRANQGRPNFDRGRYEDRGSQDRGRSNDEQSRGERGGYRGEYRGDRPYHQDRPAEDRPYGNRSYGDRRQEARRDWDRPKYDRTTGDRPARPARRPSDARDFRSPQGSEHRYEKPRSEKPKSEGGYSSPRKPKADAQPAKASNRPDTTPKKFRGVKKGKGKASIPDAFASVAKKRRKP